MDVSKSWRLMRGWNHSPDFCGDLSMVRLRVHWHWHKTMAICRTEFCPGRVPLQLEWRRAEYQWVRHPGPGAKLCQSQGTWNLFVSPCPLRCDSVLLDLALLVAVFTSTGRCKCSVCPAQCQQVERTHIISLFCFALLFSNVRGLNPLGWAVTKSCVSKPQHCFRGV